MGPDSARRGDEPLCLCSERSRQQERSERAPINRRGGFDTDSDNDGIDDLADKNPGVDDKAILDIDGGKIGVVGGARGGGLSSKTASAIGKALAAKAKAAAFSANIEAGKKAEAAALAAFESRTGLQATTQITFVDPESKARARIDAVAFDPHRSYLSVDGAKANRGKPMRGQPAVLAAAAKGTAVPVGKKAQQAGLAIGTQASTREATITNVDTRSGNTSTVDVGADE